MPDQFGNLTPEELAAQEAKKAISGGTTKSKPATGSKKTIARKDLKSAQSIGGSQSSGENTTLSPTKGTDFEKRELPGTKTVNVNDISGVNKNSNAGNEVISEAPESQLSNGGSDLRITTLETGGDNITADESDGVIGDLVFDGNNSNPANFSWLQELDAGGDGTEEEPATESGTDSIGLEGSCNPKADAEQAQKEEELVLNRFVQEHLDTHPLFALVEWDVYRTVSYKPIRDYSNESAEDYEDLVAQEWEEYSSMAGVPTDYRDDLMEREKEQEKAEQKQLAEDWAEKSREIHKNYWEEHYFEKTTEEKLEFAESQLDEDIYNQLADVVNFDLGDDATQEEIDVEMTRRYGNSFDEEPWQDVASEEEVSEGIDNQSTNEPPIELYSQTGSDWSDYPFWVDAKGKPGTISNAGCFTAAFANDLRENGYAWMEIKPDYVASKVQKYIDEDPKGNTPRDYFESGQLMKDFSMIKGYTHYEGDNPGLKGLIDELETGKTAIMLYDAKTVERKDRGELVFSQGPHYVNVLGVDSNTNGEDDDRKIYFWDVNGNNETREDAGINQYSGLIQEDYFESGIHLRINYYVFSYIDTEEE